MVKTREEFLADLGRDVDRWKAELAQVEAKMPGTSLAAEIRSWITEAEGIISKSIQEAPIPKYPRSAL
jgi:hypothetical protein